MNNWIKFIGCILLPFAIASCVQEKKGEVKTPPMAGEVEYEISYSKDIFDNFLVGQFLPRKISGEYNKEGIKLNASCGFGVLNVNMVFTPADSYVDIQLPDDRVLIPVHRLVLQDSIAAYNGRVLVEHSDSMVNVMGYESKSMVVTVDYDKTASNIPTHPGNIEIFYVPLEGVDYTIAGLPQFTVPGIITAMKMHSDDDKSVMLMISKLKEKKSTNIDFDRPRGVKEITVKELIDMKSMVEVNQ